MSYFGTCLDELLKRKKIKAVDLAKMSGIGEPMISRYRKGDQVWIDPEDLTALASAISDNPIEQAELIRARLLDECTGPGSELISINIAGERRASATASFELPADLEDHFRVIREWVVKDNNVREVIEGLGGVLASGDVRQTGNRTTNSSPVGAAPGRKIRLRAEKFSSTETPRHK